MSHAEIYERLEAFALGTLPASEAAYVAVHLRTCATCQEMYAYLTEAVAGLAESVPSREPSPALRERVLAAAVRERRPSYGAFAIFWRRPAVAFAALALGLTVGAGVLLVDARRELGAVSAERDALSAIAQGVRQGGRWWYMAGVDQFDGSGGTLIVSRSEGRAFVLFHDLRTVSAPSQYVVWLIRADGGWVRAASFAPSGASLQRVDLTLQVSDFVQCAVTVETTPGGKGTGTLVMQSRIFQP